MARHEFKFQDTVEIIAVGGKEFRLDLNDEKLREIQKTFRSFVIDHMEFAKEVQALEESGESVSEEKDQEMWDKAYEMTKVTLDTTIGEGTFEEVYEISGKSIAGVAEFVMYVSGIVEAKVTEMQKARASKYTQKAGR